MDEWMFVSKCMGAGYWQTSVGDWILWQWWLIVLQRHLRISHGGANLASTYWLVLNTAGTIT